MLGFLSNFERIFFCINKESNGLHACFEEGEGGSVDGAIEITAVHNPHQKTSRDSVSKQLIFVEIGDSVSQTEGLCGLGRCKGFLCFVSI